MEPPVIIGIVAVSIVAVIVIVYFVYTKVIADDIPAKKPDDTKTTAPPSNTVAGTVALTGTGVTSLSTNLSNSVAANSTASAPLPSASAPLPSAPVALSSNDQTAFYFPVEEKYASNFPNIKVGDQATIPGLAYPAGGKLYVMKDSISRAQWEDVYSKNPTAYATVSPFVLIAPVDNRPIPTATANLTTGPDKLLIDGMCYTLDDGNLYKVVFSTISNGMSGASISILLAAIYLNKMPQVLAATTPLVRCYE